MRCYFDETEKDCTIVQLKPGLKSMAQYFFYFLLFKEFIINMHI